jgi:hypothetical protein
MEDTDCTGEASPKEGKFSTQLNSYMSFVNRNKQ